MEVGLHQGSALGPYLFHILIDEKGEEGSCGIDDVCRRHCTAQRQGSGHDGVLGDVEESFGNASQSTEDPVHGLCFRTEWPRTQTTSEGPWGGSRKSDTRQLPWDDEFRGGRRYAEMEIATRDGAAWRNWKRCSGVLCDKRMPVKLKGEGLQNSCQTCYAIWSGNMGHHRTTGSKD